MKNMAFACKAKDLRKNLKFLWQANRFLSSDRAKIVEITRPIIEPKGY